MSRRMATLGVLIGALLFLGGETAPRAASCKEVCYQAKSTAYQRCRTVPPGNRAARAQCFQQADQTLQRCLASCR